MRHDPTYVVLGGTGHIGSATARTLLQQSRRVRVVTRSTEKASAWAALAAEPVVADIEEPAAMAQVLASSSAVRVFALNPPGSIAGDPDADEDRTADAIAAALDAAIVDRVVALSTYGARPGRQIGDLGTLYRFESLLADLNVPTAIVRAGYLFSNWDGAAETARTQGQIAALLDPTCLLPMVAPADVGREAARLLQLNEPDRRVHHVEGPHRYTPDDVAQAFADALGLPVAVKRTPPQKWRTAFLEAGFSTAAADSFTGLTALANCDHWDVDGDPTRGTITLKDYINDLLVPDAKEQ